MQKSLTVLIGRVSIFHNGHAEVLKRALMKSTDVLLLIGSTGLARNTKNPFTFEERKKVVLDWYNGLNLYECVVGNLHIRPLKDHPYNDQAWIKEVQAAVVSVKRVTGIIDEPVYLTGSDRDTSTWYLKVFGNFFQMDLVKESDAGFELSSTTLRADYFSTGRRHETKCPEVTSLFLDKFRKTEEYENLVKEYQFIKKYKDAWKAAPYAPTFVTVDACVVQSGHVLVVERDAFPGNGLWALPGGFLEQDEKLVDGCVRELVEETSIELSKAQLYGSISDKETFDHPDRSSRGRTITTCFLFRLKDSATLPKTRPQKGEVRKIHWLPIHQALEQSDKWFEDHHAMLTTMISRIRS